jgi:hypothetical protein
MVIHDPIQVALEMALAGASNQNIELITRLTFERIEILKKEHGINSEKIQSNLRKNGQRPPLLPKSMQDKVVRLKQEGFSYFEISREMTIPYTAVYNAAAPAIRGPSKPTKSDEAELVAKFKARKENNSHSIRNDRIQRLAMLGKTLQEIGSDVGVTRERVRQILNEMNSKKPIEVRNAHNSAAENRHRNQKVELCDWVKNHPGCYFNEVDAHFGRKLSTQGIEIPSEVKHLIAGIDHKKTAPKILVWTEKQIISILQIASEHHNPLSRMLYDELREVNSISGPSGGRIIQVFGTWSNACKSAGIKSGDMPRVQYKRKWTEDSIASHLGKFLMENNSFSFNKYDLWSRTRAGAPSPQTVRNRIGGKVECLNLAHQHLRKTWFRDDEAKRNWVRD